MKKKKKVILIAAGLVGAVIIIALILKPTAKHGNKLEMDYCSVQDNHLPMPKYAQLVFENSMSMQGYVKSCSYGEEQFNMNFDSNMGKIISDLTNSDVQLKWSCGSKKGESYEDFHKSKITSGSFFNGGNSELDDYIADACKNTNDSTVQLLVSDFLYYSENKNFHAGASSNLYNSYSEIHKNSFAVMMVQYSSDFNGDWYYTRTNRQPFKKTIMKDRPYYVMVMGKEDFLKHMVVDGIFKKATQIYASFGLNERDFKTQTVTPSNPNPINAWTLFDPQATEDCYTLFTSALYQDTKLVTNFTFDKITIPAYIGKDWRPEIEGKATIDKISNTEVSVTFNAFNTLEEEEDYTVSLLTSNNWVDKCSIPDDENVNIEQIEGKTLCLDAIVKCIEDVYYPQGRKPSIIGQFKFKTLKK